MISKRINEPFLGYFNYQEMQKPFHWRGEKGKGEQIGKKKL
jgi:hypothetical protein